MVPTSPRVKVELLPITHKPCTTCSHSPFLTLLQPAMCLVAQLCLTLCDPIDCSPPGSSVHGDSPGKKTGVGYHALLQRIFPTQGSNPGLPHCMWILYHLSHQGSPTGQISINTLHRLLPLGLCTCPSPHIRAWIPPSSPSALCLLVIFFSRPS